MVCFIVSIHSHLSSLDMTTKDASFELSAYKHLPEMPWWLFLPNRYFGAHCIQWNCTLEAAGLECKFVEFLWRISLPLASSGSVFVASLFLAPSYQILARALDSNLAQCFPFRFPGTSRQYTFLLPPCSLPVGSTNVDWAGRVQKHGPSVGLCTCRYKTHCGFTQDFWNSPRLHSRADLLSLLLCWDHYKTK